MELDNKNLTLVYPGSSDDILPLIAAFSHYENYEFRWLEKISGVNPLMDKMLQFFRDRVKNIIYVDIDPYVLDEEDRLILPEDAPYRTVNTFYNFWKYYLDSLFPANGGFIHYEDEHYFKFIINEYQGWTFEYHYGTDFLNISPQSTLGQKLERVDVLYIKGFFWDDLTEEDPMGLVYNYFPNLSYIIVNGVSIDTQKKNIRIIDGPDISWDAITGLDIWALDPIDEEF